MREIKYEQMPVNLRVIAEPFKENIKIFECNDMNEIIMKNRETKLETTVINQLDDNNMVERHFYIGLRIEVDLDYNNNPVVISPPEMYFAEMNEGQYNKFKEVISKKLMNMNHFR